MFIRRQEYTHTPSGAFCLDPTGGYPYSELSLLPSAIFYQIQLMHMVQVVMQLDRLRRRDSLVTYRSIFYGLANYNLRRCNLNSLLLLTAYIKSLTIYQSCGYSFCRLTKVRCDYQNLRSRFGIERYAYTESNSVCMYVCMYVCDKTPPKPLNRFA